MKYILSHLAVFMLLLSSVFLAVRIRDQVQRYRTNRGEWALTPRDGSLEGIDAKGNTRTPNIEPDGHLERRGYLLVFVIHRHDISKGVQYWNRVIDLANGLGRVTGAPIQYWGICDEGLGCNSPQLAPHFTLLGYLDPYQMHAVAKAAANDEVLLYDHSLTLRARIPTAADPSAELNLILKQVNPTDAHDVSKNS